jgi:multidrug efflux pump subunit AcrB
MIDGMRLRAHGIAASALVGAIDAHRGSVSGASVLRTTGAFARAEEVSSLALATPSGVPVRVSDVATIAEVGTKPDCIAARDGKESVLAQVSLFPAADVAKTAAAVGARLRELDGRLSAGIELLEMEARAPWVHARLTGAIEESEAIVAAEVQAVDGSRLSLLQLAREDSSSSPTPRPASGTSPARRSSMRSPLR